MGSAKADNAAALLRPHTAAIHRLRAAMHDTWRGVGRVERGLLCSVVVC
jgi:hypothetical protein